MYSTVTAPPTINEAVLVEALNAVSSGNQATVISSSGHVQEHPSDDAGVVGIVAAELLRDGVVPPLPVPGDGAHGFTTGPPTTPRGMPVGPPSTPESDIGTDGYVCAVRGCHKKPWPESGRCTAHGGEPTPPRYNQAVEISARHRKKRSSASLCLVEGCTNVAQARGICLKHGANQLKKKKKALPCKVEGCTSVRHGGNFCLRHGGGAKCRYPGCGQPCRHPTPLCHAHGAMPSSYTACDVPGCGRRCLVVAGGRCHDHGGYTAVGMCQDLNCFKLAKKPSIYCGTHGSVPQCHGAPSCRRRPVGNTGLCRMHGGQPDPATCSTPGCSNLALPSGPGGQRVCPIHWDGVTTLVQRCSHIMCQRPAREYGLCVAHGGARPQCSVPGCIQPVANRRVVGDNTVPDKCRMHLGPEYSRRCIVKGCMKARMLNDDSAGMCAKHHMESLQGEVLSLSGPARPRRRADGSVGRIMCSVEGCNKQVPSTSGSGKCRRHDMCRERGCMRAAFHEGYCVRHQDLVIADALAGTHQPVMEVNTTRMPHGGMDEGNVDTSGTPTASEAPPEGTVESRVHQQQQGQQQQQQQAMGINEGSLVIPHVDNTNVSSSSSSARFFPSPPGPSHVQYTDEERAAEAVAAVVVMEMEAERQQRGGGESQKSIDALKD